jgi:hypothetical protein
MARHLDWSVTACLIGLGQEINDGEEGLGGWADAIEELAAPTLGWAAYGPAQIFGGERSASSLGTTAMGVQVVLIRCSPCAVGGFPN